MIEEDDGASETALIAFTPTDLEPLLEAWRSTVGSDPPSTVRVDLDERFVLFLDQPSAWAPHGWPRRFDVLDLESQPVVSRLDLPEGWRADEIVPGCGYVFRPKQSTLIGAVEPGGTMARAGVLPGDRLMAIDGAPVATEDQVKACFAAWLAEKKPLFAKRREVEVTFERAGETHVARVVPGTIELPTGFVAALGYETETEESDVVTPSELVYLAIETVRQLAGTMPAAMGARIVPRELEPAPAPAPAIVIEPVAAEAEAEIGPEASAS